MTNIALPRRDFLALAGAALTTTAFPETLRAQGAAAALNFGFPNASWGTIGMIGEAHDLFKKAGANVKVFSFDSGKTTRDAMISRRIDIGVIGSTPFVIGAAKGEMEGIAIALYGAKTLSLVGSVKAGIKSVQDLKGRNIGSQLGSVTDFVLKNKILPKYGLKAGDVHIINVRFQNQVPALAAGSIDAFRRRRTVRFGGRSREPREGAGRLQRFRSGAGHPRRQQVGGRREARSDGRVPARLARQREGVP